jgi:hypothetical protein
MPLEMFVLSLYYLYARLKNSFEASWFLNSFLSCGSL